MFRLANPVLLLLALTFIFSGFRCQFNPARTQDPPPGGIDFIDLPEGFHIHYFARNITGARSMVRGDNGTLFVGTRSQGKVYALRDEDGDFNAEKVHTIATGLNSPN